MGTLGPNGGSTFVDDSTVGAVGVSNPSNAGTSDGSFVTWVLLLGQLGDYLKATGFNFAIPLDATILGIQVEVQQQSTVGAAVTDNSVKIVKGGVISGNEKATGTTWPTSEAFQTYGSASDTWGLSWVPTDINVTTFGIAVSPTCGAAATAQVDYIRITVTYSGSNRCVEADHRVMAGDGMSCVERV